MKDYIHVLFSSSSGNFCAELSSVYRKMGVAMYHKLVCIFLLLALSACTQNRSEMTSSELPPVGVASEDETAALVELSDEDNKLVANWISDSCPRSLGPSMWSNCMTREVEALQNANIDFDVSEFSQSDMRWLAETCPVSLPPSLFVRCIEREGHALSRLNSAQSSIEKQAQPK